MKRSNHKTNNKGIANIFAFSRKEIVVLIIITAIVFTGAIMKYIAILKSANEEAVLQNLIALRYAIALYYNDHEEIYPSADIVKELINGKYITSIPYISIPNHNKTNKITIYSASDKNLDSGGWIYKADDSSDNTGKSKGDIWVNCSHTDSKGNIWSSL
jgi:type II secretory pathway pseudopilin PulG